MNSIRIFKTIVLLMLFNFSLKANAGIVDWFLKSDPITKDFCGINVDSWTFTAEQSEVLKDDLNFISKLEGQIPDNFTLHKEVFGTLNIDGNIYCKFLEKRIKYLAVGKSKSLTASMSPSGYLKVGATFFTEFTRAQRIGILFHEVMHSAKYGDKQGIYFGHHYCPTPFLDENGKDILGYFTSTTIAGTETCDSDILSSSSVAYIWIKNISMFCENCNDDFTQDANQSRLFFLQSIDNFNLRSSFRSELGEDFK